MSNSPSSEPEVLEPIVPTPEDATSEDDFIRLNRRELSNEIKKLQSEDKKFLQVYNSHVGEYAKRKYDPELRARDSRIEELQLELRRRDILAMEPKDIEEQFESDPEFALEYAKLIHHRPQETPAPVDESPQILSAWNTMVEWAKAKGVPEAKIQEVTNRAAEGEYSSDNVHWSVSLQRIQSELTEDLLKTKTPASTVNPELARKGPDLSSGNHSGSTSFKFKTVAEFKALPVEEQKSILRTPEGMEAVTNLSKKG